MKLSKLPFMAIVTVLTMWTSFATSEPALSQFEKLSFCLTAGQQGPTLPNALVSTISASRINNRELLSFLATALNTNWPNGAQLALDKNTKDIVVVDKSGTSLVFDVSVGINNGGTNVVFFSFISNPTIFASGKWRSARTGGLKSQTHFGMIFFHLFAEDNGMTNTDLTFDGLNTSEWNIEEKQDIPFPPITIIIGRDVATVAGDGIFNGIWTVVEGNVTGSGKWILAPVVNLRSQ
ncbi:MAG: hypothetical protein ABSA45_10595 [Verrucomicrobiota bacterium]|jgi:hypothetical protein